MGYPLFSNNAGTGLVYPITTSATTLYVNGGSGSLFPSPTAGQYFPITLLSQQYGYLEIVYCTARSGDVLTVVRAQEGTTAHSFATGDAVQQRITAGSLNDLRGADNVTDLYAGTGIAVSGNTGAITVSNTGVTALNAGTGISLSGSTGTITITGPTTVTNANNLTTTNFTITESGGKLIFKYGATTIASLDSSGNFVNIGSTTSGT
jgi:hypothetical protein